MLFRSHDCVNELFVCITEQIFLLKIKEMSLSLQTLFIDIKLNLKLGTHKTSFKIIFLAIIMLPICVIGSFFEFGN